MCLTQTHTPVSSTHKLNRYQKLKVSPSWHIKNWFYYIFWFHRSQGHTKSLYLCRRNVRSPKSSFYSVQEYFIWNKRRISSFSRLCRTKPVKQSTSSTGRFHGDADAFECPRDTCGQSGGCVPATLRRTIPKSYVCNYVFSFFYFLVSRLCWSLLFRHQRTIKEIVQCLSRVSEVVAAHLASVFCLSWPVWSMCLSLWIIDGGQVHAGKATRPQAAAGHGERSPGTQTRARAHTWSYDSFWWRRRRKSILRIRTRSSDGGQAGERSFTWANSLLASKEIKDPTQTHNRFVGIQVLFVSKKGMGH